MNDDRYMWKDRKLDPDSRRTFEGFVWWFIAMIGFLVIVWLVTP